jgi:uncharacterized protein (TIGR02145 family)
MTSVNRTRSIEMRVVSLVLALACGSASATLEQRSAPGQTSSGAAESKRLADGRQWTTHNLNVATVPSSCYDEAELNCRQYGRLYTWESARRGCESLGDGWRLPTDDDWRQLAKHYGGVFQDSADEGSASYTALLTGGGSGFNALLGGGRNADDGRYARLEAHGFYWTASARDPTSAVFYNFGRGRPALYRQEGGDKRMAISVRCVKD